MGRVILPFRKGLIFMKLGFRENKTIMKKFQIYSIEVPQICVQTQGELCFVLEEKWPKENFYMTKNHPTFAPLLAKF